MKALTVCWISAVRSSRQPLRGFLRVRNSVNAIKNCPHAEEHPRRCVSKHATTRMQACAEAHQGLFPEGVLPLTYLWRMLAIRL
jgi:hypothetical protein